GCRKIGMPAHLAGLNLGIDESRVRTRRATDAAGQEAFGWSLNRTLTHVEFEPCERRKRIGSAWLLGTPGHTRGEQDYGRAAGHGEQSEPSPIGEAKTDQCRFHTTFLLCKGRNTLHPLRF